MASSTNTMSNNKYRDELINDFILFLKERGEDVIQIETNQITFPFVNELKSDEWLKIVFSIPRGNPKEGVFFDGYELGKEFEAKEIKRIETAKKREEDKVKKIATDTAKRQIASKKIKAE